MWARIVRPAKAYGVKRGGPQHRKIRRLARLLGVRRHAAVGLVEMVLHATARERPRGDIGAFTDEDIAEELDWVEDPQVLVQALEAAGFLDAHAEHRYVVHDWPEHCEDAVHTALCRRQVLFADGSAPSPSRLAGLERERANAWLAEVKSTRALAERSLSARRALAERPASASASASASAEEEKNSSLGGAGGEEPARRTRASRGASLAQVDSVLGAAQRRLEARRRGPGGA